MVGYPNQTDNGLHWEQKHMDTKGGHTKTVAGIGEDLVRAPTVPATITNA